MAMTPAIPTVSGRTINLRNPDPMSINIVDIAVHLSRINRFTGATNYSVAQHSVLVSRICRKPFAGLMHDAHEAYVGDATSPLKLLLPELQVIERCVAHAVAQAFGMLPGDWECAEVKEADMILLATERRDLIPPNACEWVELPPPMTDVIEPWPAETAAALFLMRYRELTGVAY